MADNVTLDNNTTTGQTIRTVRKASVQYPVSILDVGTHPDDNTGSSNLVSKASNVGMPVEGLSDSQTVSSGAPVLIGAKHLSTAPNLTSTHVATLLVDSRNNLSTTIVGKNTDNGIAIDGNGAISVTGVATIDYDTDSGTDNTTCVGIAVPASGGAAAVKSTSIQDEVAGVPADPVVGLNTSQIGSFFFDGHTGPSDTTNVASFGLAIPSASGPVVIDNGTNKLSVDVSTIPSVQISSSQNTVKLEAAATATDVIGTVKISATNNTVQNKLTHIGTTAVSASSGNKDDGTQRVVIADNDTNLSAIKTAVELIDDAVATDKIAIAGRTTIANPLTATALLVDSAGHLQVDVLSSTLNSIGGSSVSVNSGNKNDGTQRVVIATDDVNISNLSSVVKTANAAITTPDTAAKVSMIGAVVDDVLEAASTPYTDGDAAPLKVTGTGALHVEVGTPSLGASTNSIGKLAENSGVDIGDVDVASISEGTSLIGDVGIQGRTTGGLSMHSKLDYVNTPVDVKASAGTVYGITVFNMTASPFYIKFYNETTSVNRATHTPVLRFAVPANASSSGAGFVFNIPQGLAFGSQIQYAITTGVADTDTSGISSGNAVVNIAYK